MTGFLMNTIFTNMAVSVTELKRNFANIIKQADDCPVAILNHNRAEAYLLPAAHYERLMAHLEDLEDAKLVQERANGPFIEVSLDEL
jgi:antitoxin StbD